MPSDWPFAKLVKDAARAGGPEQFVEQIRRAGELRGAAKATLIITLGISGVKLVGWLKHKYDESQEAGKQAEADLIAAIKEYEEEHPEDPVPEEKPPVASEEENG